MSAISTTSAVRVTVAARIRTGGLESQSKALPTGLTTPLKKNRAVMRGKLAVDAGIEPATT
ncbi:hypothetical protein [Massilia genomosp. 1]|uniref:Uncharacterized protein n=1 Tax=Massilia genomosp. 1 TaxID=2609280 RepID=A0ABX0N4J3_9BURK|nr:hypothetical protein [Massilia genomosp. 1]NHZ66950.1 hypothetical protein [Massilia genomosp. 1]